MTTLLVTGGAGFIGGNFVRYLLDRRKNCRIVNLDALTYAGNLASIDDLSRTHADRYRFVRGNILDTDLLTALFEEETIGGVVHFAAESHVDRSIKDPLSFITTNVNGTCALLSVARDIWQDRGKPPAFRFIHVSTDEVYGTLGAEGYFSESSPYDPSSPYSASKASSDHFARAWFTTYGFPTIVTNCSNNFGPFQFPEKLIPLMILNILEEKPLPVYGDGSNVRDWLYVRDHCEALERVLEKGVPGETYLIGGGSEQRNIDIVDTLCAILDRRLGRSGRDSSRRLVTFVADRPGHDFRYAIDAGKIERELGWKARHGFNDALEETVDWYLAHPEWVDSIRSGDYLNWIDANYGNR
jgi:dTDP-glucose 4,6-dehydratase